MRNSGRWMWLGEMFVLAALLLASPGGCSQNANLSSPRSGIPLVRVRLLQDQHEVDLAAAANPSISTSLNPALRVIGFPEGETVSLSLAPDGWRLGSLALGAGELRLLPSAVGSVSVNGQLYRGSYRFVQTGAGRFDVVNDVDIDGYLKGVLAKELFHDWHPETYRAQAVVARTYALYEANTSGIGRYWDVYPDQRSQMYGGLSAETSMSRSAVDYTTGIVLVYGLPGQERIFKAYFSSCCGGITQSAADAFPGDPLIPPLIEQDVGSLCNASPHFNWGPIVIPRTELARRIRFWADRKARQDGHPRAESRLAGLARIDTAAVNHYGRPVRFVMTDVVGNQYSFTSEEMRSALNADAGTGPTLPSSFCRIDNGVQGSEVIRFIDGHGFGHGVGMCQWCAEARAAMGMSHEQIVLLAFPHAKLARAY